MQAEVVEGEILCVKYFCWGNNIHLNTYKEPGIVLVQGQQRIAQGLAFQGWRVNPN